MSFTVILEALLRAAPGLALRGVPNLYLAGIARSVLGGDPSFKPEP